METRDVTSRKTPYDRGWSWMVVLGMFMMHVFLIGYVKTFGLLFVELQDMFALTSQQTAWVSTAMLLTIDILSPLGTALGDRYGSRTVVMTGGLVVCLSLVLSSRLYNIQYMVAVMGALFGVGAALCYAPSMIMVGYYFKRRLGLANALAVTGSSLGQFLLPPIVTVLLDQYCLSGTLLILAAIMFNLTLGGALLRPVTFYQLDGTVTDVSSELTSSDVSSEPSERIAHSADDDSIDDQLLRGHRWQSNGYCDQCKDGVINCDIENLCIKDVENGNCVRKRTQQRLFVKRPVDETLQYTSSMDLHCSMNVPTSKILVSKLRQRDTCSGFLRTIFDLSLLKNPVYCVFALGCTMVNFSYIGTFRYLPAHCKDVGIGEAERAMLLSLVGVTDLVSRLFVGVVADSRIVRRDLKRYRLLALALLLLGGNGWFLVYSSEFWMLAASCVGYGVCGGVYMTLLSVSLVDLLGAQHLSRAWGIMLLLYGVTTLGEPLVLGYLRDVTGTYAASFMTCAVLFLAGGLCVLLSPHAKRCQRSWRHNGNR